MRTRLPTRNLDVLRAIAVLCVLLDHTLAATLLPHATWLAEVGRAGVLLFFVHTSLVLMASLERSGERPFAFYVRRAFRIYPLAIATILLVVVAGLPAGEVTWSRLAANLTLTQNLVGERDLLGPLWSLPLEVQMYVVLPVCFLIAQRGVRATALLFSLAVSVGVLVATNPHLWRLQVGLYGPCFVAGVLAFALLRTGRSPRVPAWTWPLLVVDAVALAVLLSATASHPARGWFACLAVGLLIPLVRDLPESWLTRRAATIATYSYGIYLLHDPAIHFAFQWGRAWPVAAQWLAFGALVVALPVVAYHAVERPGIEWGKRLAVGIRPHVGMNSSESRWAQSVGVLWRSMRP